MADRWPVAVQRLCERQLRICAIEQTSKISNVQRPGKIVHGSMRQSSRFTDPVAVVFVFGDPPNGLNDLNVWNDWNQLLHSNDLIGAQRLSVLNGLNANSREVKPGGA